MNPSTPVQRCISPSSSSHSSSLQIHHFFHRLARIAPERFFLARRPLLEVFVGEGMDVDEFRARLRVLAVDDDRVSLLLIAKQLRLCKYNVTTVMHPEVALEMLRARRDCDDQFDLVITDVHMPGMDGFKLLEHIGLEMDIPVIMLSANDTLASMMKGIQHGARDYLVKPVRLEQLKRLCIHVVMKVKDNPSNNTNNSNDTDDDQSENGANHTMKCLRKKKKDGDSAREGKENTSTPTKRQRVQWSGELHRKFVRVINQIGIDKAVPKTILEMMNVEGLTREHVASHLQKYRLYLKKISNGTFRSSSPFTDEAMWSEGNSININGQEHFEHNLEHGRYQPSLSFASSSNSSNPFARMNSPAAFRTHNLLPTQSVQLMTQRNLGIPLDMGPVGYGGNMPQVVIPGSQPGLRNFTSTGNSNTNMYFPSGPSGSSFANIPNGMPFNTSKHFPSGTSSNSFANIPNGNSPLLASSMEPRVCPIKSYASLFHGKYEGASRGFPFDEDNSFESISDGQMLPPSSNLPMQHPESAAQFGLSGSINSGKSVVPSRFLDLGCKDAMSESGLGNKCKINRLSRLAASFSQKSEFRNQMAALTRTSTPMACFNEQVAPFNIGSTTNSTAMTNDNSTPGGVSSAISTLPNFEMNKPIMPSQMLNGGGEGGSLPKQDGIIDQQAVGDQLNNNKGFLTATSTAQNGTNDALDDFFGDWLSQDVLKNDDAFMEGDWEFEP